MLNWFIHRRLAAFERRYGYDAGYAHDLLDASLGSFLRYARITPMAEHRDQLPLEPWYAAKLLAARSEDCGPCTQLAVDKAREAGVRDATLSALLRGEFDRLEPDTALAARYALAAIGRTPELPALHDAVVRRWGERGLAALALTVTATRMFPMLKYALGHGQACQRVRVGSDTVVPVPLPATAG